MTFEELMTKLNEIADKLEDKTLTIDESFKLFEEGIQISTQCANILDWYSDRLKGFKEEWTSLQERIENHD